MLSGQAQLIGVCQLHIARDPDALLSEKALHIRIGSARFRHHDQLIRQEAQLRFRSDPIRLRRREVVDHRRAGGKRAGLSHRLRLDLLLLSLHVDQKQGHRQQRQQAKSCQRIADPPQDLSSDIAVKQNGRLLLPAGHS